MYMNQAYLAVNETFLSTKDNNAYLIDGMNIMQIWSCDSTYRLAECFELKLVET